MDVTTYPSRSTFPGATTFPGTRTYPDPIVPKTRHSVHAARARLIDVQGHVTDVGEVDVTLNLDEGLSPYGNADVVAVLTDETVLTATDPLTHRGIRLELEMRESTGDPVINSELTATYGPGTDQVKVSELTATFGPAMTPAKVTAVYFTSWNGLDVRPGGVIRADLLVTGRSVDYTGSQMTFSAATDEALLLAYKLVSTSTETSGALTVRATVNYALGKVDAALLPGIDAPVVEPDAIIWEPGVSAWDYARNVAEAAGLVVRCDELRQWTLIERGATRSETVSLGSLTAADESVSLDDELWADAVVVVYNWTDPATGDSKTRYETASLGAGRIKVVTIPRETPYPGPGAAKYWLNRLKARGRVFTLEQVGDYSLRPGMGFTASLPYNGAHTGYIEAVTWSAPSDRGTIRTRDAADTVGNAIDLWATGVKIDDLVGKINDLIVIGE